MRREHRVEYAGATCHAMARGNWRGDIVLDGDILWRGAWTSLFMRSPFGELPAGYRISAE